jgi:type I restriction enzyme R subunit
MRRRDYSEDRLVEKPSIALFREMGWETIDAYDETFGATGTLGRETAQDVVLVPRLLAALRHLNPDLPDAALRQAMDQLTRDRRILGMENANREVYELLKGGANVKVRLADGSESPEKVRFIDWNDPKGNDFLLVSQLWVTGDLYRRRADLVGFVNGIPLVFIELKASHKRLEDAYKDNLRDYRSTIPQLFWFNAFIVLSNGGQARIGSTTATWEHFVAWKKINDEGEEGVISLETLLRGTCEPARMLDIVENFTVFEEVTGGLVKKIGMTHQVLGVNRAIAALGQARANAGRLGVFWHTQGSGKSLSMIFFAQKILRKLPGNWTFVVVTDRDELDEQIFKRFVACGAVRGKEVHAQDGNHLQTLLSADHRYVFTLIQKFRTERGGTYPTVSTRSDIVVITDEAHRSQYDIFAMNMRRALPNASFIGFTGTPLMAGEEKTKEVFGDYVSVYNFRQAIEDGATVPLYYENRIPELQLTNDRLTDDIYEVIEEAALDSEQEKKLERALGQDYHLITRDDRLERVAEDIVAHFMGRGQRGKAMVVCIDKATAVRMYDKVQKYWRRYRGRLAASLTKGTPGGQERTQTTLAWMDETDMAVVVSQAQNEAEDMKAKGLDIVPHRRRMVTEDLDTKFKDPDDSFRLVFVCAMWMTGFDVPSCSTIYLDKPLRNHTLMQAIARANRVAKDKVNGTIVDYVGVLRNLHKALAIYATPGAGDDGGDTPVKDKEELLVLLGTAIEETEAFCAERDVDLRGLLASGAAGFAKVREIDDAASVLVDKKLDDAVDEAVEKVILNDDLKQRFLQLASTVSRLYKAILPDALASKYTPECALISVLADKVRSFLPPPDISAVMGTIEDVLDRSIAAQGYVIRERGDGFGRVDLSQIDFEALQKAFQRGRKRTEAERLRALVGQKLQAMVALNRSRVDFVAKFKEMIDEYNAGSMNVDEFFRQLVVFAKQLSAEEKRAVSENLTEEELALFDILTKPDPVLTKAEEAVVKKVAKDLLEKLKAEKLVYEWRRRQQSRAAVRLWIEHSLDALPRAYTPGIFEKKCERTYEHIFSSYYGEGGSVYALAS